MEDATTPTLRFEDFNPEKLQSYWESVVAWCGSYFWSHDTIYQGAVVLAAFTLAIIITRFIKKPLMAKIEATPIPPQAKTILTNIRRLVLPTIALFLIFFGSKIIGVEPMNIETELIDGLSKVLLAWIVIRFAVQFIANSAVRNVFALTIWIIAALSILGVLDETTTTLDSVGFDIGDMRLSALTVIKGIISIFALLYLALFASSFAERKITQINSLTRSSQVLISKVIRVTLIVFALLIGVTSAGIDLSLFAVFGGAIGLGIGFGLQKGISNLFSGMLLLMDRSIKPGDVIEIPDIGTFGWVNHMAARYTEIVTRDNKSFLIPNEDFITQRVVNWSHGNSLIRIQIGLGVHYDSDPHMVKKIAEEAAKNAHERVVSDPAPVCWLVEFGDSSLNFSLRFWIKDAEAGVTNIKGHVMMALWDAFKENNIEIPYPHREIYMRDRKKKS